jgi:hypothetical protein
MDLEFGNYRLHRAKRLLMGRIDKGEEQLPTPR